MESARNRAMWIAVITAVPMVGQLVAGRAARDALFLTEYDASYLPGVMLAGAVLSLTLAVQMGRLMAHVGPRVVALSLAIVNGGLFAGEATLASVSPHLIAVVTYVHVSVVGALLVSAYASVVNERFDPLFAKTVVARVGTGAALGGILGGLVAFAFSERSDLATILYVLGVVNLVVGLGTWHIGSSMQPRERPSDSEARFGLRTIRDDHYLRRVAVTVMLLGAAGVFVDYAMKAEADALFADSAGLLSFFSIFYMVTALMTFIIQAGIAKRLLEKIGLGGTMVILPIAVALSAGFGLAWTRLWTTALARGSQTVFSSSLFRSGYELLYTPVSPLKKRSTKSVIDVACNRIGYGIGSLVVMGIVAVTATAAGAISWVLALAILAAIAAAWLIRRLHQDYVSQLASSLRDGSVTLQPDDIVDATTLRTFAAINRDQLLGDIDVMWQNRQTVDAPSDLIERLADDASARSAHEALQQMGPRVTGQLAEALRSTQTTVAARRRIPRLLKEIGDSEARKGLLAGLRDGEFEVRYRCGNALATLQQGNPNTAFAEAPILDAVALELSEDLGAWQGEERSLSHVFTLLGLVLDREAMILCIRALPSDDENLRGTALEYIHNVVPEPVLGLLWPKLTERAQPPDAKPAASPDELLKTMQAIVLEKNR